MYITSFSNKKVVQANLDGTDASDLGNLSGSLTFPWGIALDTSTYETAISITSSQTPVPYGTTVTFTATVTSGGGTPTGAVQFRVDGADYGDPVPLVGGLASISSASLSTGLHNITAVYHGDLNFTGGSTTSSLIQEITPRLFLPSILK